jgi:predicted Zn-dependent protease
MHKPQFFNSIFIMTALLTTILLSSGCSVNPATGNKQFDGLMSREAEASVGAAEHEKIVKEYGGLYQNQKVQAYVNSIGQNIAKNTERSEVSYKFFVLDSPIVNAFALPGGFIYITRGLMAVANDEAELAAVIAHEIGHVTGRHSAARYSSGMLTQLGATVLSAAVGRADVSRAVGLGSNLYMSSYSREQEHEADMLGVRYLARAGYDTMAMSDFLNNMERYQQAESRAVGKAGSNTPSYFSSHPPTPERVAQSVREAGRYEASQKRNRAEYQAVIAGMVYGGGTKDGFVRDNVFYHPALGFQFTVPQGYKIDNQAKQVVATGADGGIIVFDRASSQSSTPESYMANEWLAGKMNVAPETINVNGLPAAAAGFEGSIGGKPARIQMVAISWSPREVYRFQMAIPVGASAQTIDNLKRTTYSFRQMSEEDKGRIREQKIELVRAGAGDSVESIAAQMNVPSDRVARFLALNGLSSGERLVAGQVYKIVG